MRTHRARVGQPAGKSDFRNFGKNPPRPRGATAAAQRLAASEWEPTAPAWGNRCWVGDCDGTARTHRARVGQLRTPTPVSRSTGNPPRPRGATRPYSTSILLANEPTAPAWGNHVELAPGGRVDRTHRARVGQPIMPTGANTGDKNPPRPRGATCGGRRWVCCLKEPTAPAWGNPTSGGQFGADTRTHRARVGQPGCPPGLAQWRPNPPRPRGATRRRRV